jgi:hypothetical protein
MTDDDALIARLNSYVPSYDPTPQDDDCRIAADRIAALTAERNQALDQCVELHKRIAALKAQTAPQSPSPE